MSYQLLVNKISFGSKGLDIVPNYKKGKILIIKNNLFASDEIAKLLERLNENDIEIINLSNNEIRKIETSVIVKNSKYNTVSKIFTIGGGTMIDLSKRIKFELETLYKMEIDFYIIPSRIGSGAESSSSSIINLNDRKDIKTNDRFIPSGVIYFTELYKSLEQDEISMGAIDAATHCIESILSINKNNYLDFLSTQTINYIYKKGIFEKILNEKEFDEFDFINLSTLSFNGGVAQNNAGAGLCHALAHAAETITGIKHIECINYFFSSIIKYIKHTDKNFSNLFDPKIVNLICKVTEKLKLKKDTLLLDNILNDNEKTAKLIKMAKKDPCWRLYKRKIDENLLIRHISK